MFQCKSTRYIKKPQAINNATAGQEKLSDARNMANELNNYTDPNLVENVSKSIWIFNFNNLFIILGGHSHANLSAILNYLKMKVQ